MKILQFIKKLFIAILLFAALGGLFVFHISLPGTQERLAQQGTTDYRRIFVSAYEAYRWSSLSTAYEKTDICAKDLYQKEVAEGKTDEELSGWTYVDYFQRAFDSHDYDDKISEKDRLALLIPLFSVILLIIALFAAVKFGLKSIRSLSFENKATGFKK